MDPRFRGDDTIAIGVSVGVIPAKAGIHMQSEGR
jgi:hypothetical protein